MVLKLNSIQLCAQLFAETDPGCCEIAAILAREVQVVVEDEDKFVIRMRAHELDTNVDEANDLVLVLTQDTRAMFGTQLVEEELEKATLRGSVVERDEKGAFGKLEHAWIITPALLEVAQRAMRRRRRTRSRFRNCTE